MQNVCPDRKHALPIPSFKGLSALEMNDAGFHQSSFLRSFWRNYRRKTLTSEMLPSNEFSYLFDLKFVKIARWKTLVQNSVLPNA